MAWFKRKGIKKAGQASQSEESESRILSSIEESEKNIMGEVQSQFFDTFSSHLQIS